MEFLPLPHQPTQSPHYDTRRKRFGQSGYRLEQAAGHRDGATTVDAEFSAKSLAAIALEWVMMVSAAVACWQVMHWNVYAAVPAYLLTILFIGSRQHALAILMHEGAHYRLMKNRVANDFFAELFTAWPMHIAMRNYREHHFPHHRAPNTDDDPDWTLRREDDSWEFPKTKFRLATMFLFDFLGLRMVDQYRTFGRYTFPHKRKRDWIDWVREGYTLTLIVSFTYFGLWIPYLVFWMVPMLTWLKVVLRMRTIAEHYALDYGHMFRQTRTTYPELAGANFHRAEQHRLPPRPSSLSQRAVLQPAGTARGTAEDGRVPQAGASHARLRAGLARMPFAPREGDGNHCALGGGFAPSFVSRMTSNFPAETPRRGEERRGVRETQKPPMNADQRR